MSSEDNGENIKKYKCSNQDCEQSFTTAGNRNRHEKRFDHTPPPRRSFKNQFSKKKRVNTTVLLRIAPRLRNLKETYIDAGCAILRRKKEEKGKNKVCTQCDMTFTQRSNQDRHIRRVHLNEVLEPVLSMYGVAISGYSRANANFRQQYSERDECLSLPKMAPYSSKV